MSLYPGAKLKLLPESDTQPRIKPRAIILHSAGGGSELYGWWMNKASNGLESHFWIGWEGEIVQYIDTNVRADANGEANSFAISIETASSVHASEPWTVKQVASILDLLDWLCTEHRIPRRQMAHKTDAGIGWHVMFGAPGPWTKARGKVCPGPRRIDQTIHDIIPALAKTPAPAPAPTPEGFLMAGTPETEEALAILRRLDANTPRKPFALRDRRDGRVWVITPNGRWWVRNMDALSLLIYTGQVQGFGPDGVPVSAPGDAGAAMIDGIFEIDQPSEVEDLVKVLDAIDAAAKAALPTA